MAITRNIRNGAPKNTIYLWSKNGCIPSDFSHECRLYSQHIKTIVNACTNPNACVGAVHTIATTTVCHTHGFPINPGPGMPSCGRHSHVWNTGAQPNSPSYPWASNCTIGTGVKTPHSHNLPVGCGGSPMAIPFSPSTSPHSHGNSTCEDPTHKTIRHIKYTPSGIRRKSLPMCTTLLFADPVACIPCNWAVNSSMVGNHIFKGVANSCASVLACGGTNHTHPASGCHTHGYTQGPHVHIIPSSTNYIPFTPCPSGQRSFGSPSCPCVYKDNHGHFTPSPTPVPAPTMVNPTGCSPSSGSHSHSSSSVFPPYKEYAFISANSISMRRAGIPTKGLVEWLEPLACIPPCLLLADGTCGTDNSLNTWIRSTLNACTNPGTTGGCATHTHCAASHQHPAFSINHYHNMSSVPITLSCSPTNTKALPGPFNSVGPHTHTTPGSTSPIIIPLNASSTTGPHSHPSACSTYDPPAKSIALLQRL